MSRNILFLITVKKIMHKFENSATNTGMLFIGLWLVYILLLQYLSRINFYFKAEMTAVFSS